jgi:hypothetical protein
MKTGLPGGACGPWLFACKEGSDNVAVRDSHRWLSKSPPLTARRTTAATVTFGSQPANMGRSVEENIARAFGVPCSSGCRAAEPLVRPRPKIKVGNDLANDIAIDWFSLQSASQRQCIETEIVDVTRNAFATLGNERKRVPRKHRHIRATSGCPQSVSYVERRLFRSKGFQTSK